MLPRFVWFVKILKDGKLSVVAELEAIAALYAPMSSA